LHIAERILEKHPNHPEALSIKGVCLQSTGKIAEAKKLFEDILKTSPNFLPALMNKGTIALVEGKNEDALSTFDFALRSVLPPLVLVLVNKSLALIRLRRFDEAEECCAQALALDKNNLQVWNARADCDLGRELLSEAKERYDKVLAIDPKNDWALQRKQVVVDLIQKKRW